MSVLELFAMFAVLCISYGLLRAAAVFRTLESESHARAARLYAEADAIQAYANGEVW